VIEENAKSKAGDYDEQARDLLYVYDVIDERLKVKVV